MTNEIRPPVSRRVLPWVVGSAFVITALVAAWRVASLRTLAIEHERAQIQEFVEDQVDAWEDAVMQDLQEMLEVVAMQPEQSQTRQNQLRRTRRSFNSLYVWQAHPEGNRLVYPDRPTPDGHELIQSRQCIRTANIFKRQLPVDPVQLARAYTVGCYYEHPLVRVYAAAEAAYHLKSVGRYAEGLEALDRARIPNDVSLVKLARQGLSPWRVAVLRIARAKLLLDLNRTEEGLDLLERLALQIVELDAPDLGAPLRNLMPGEQGILGTLHRYGRHKKAARIEYLAERAQRRLVAYEEVLEQIVPRAPVPDAEPRLIRDQYSDEAPYLLYFGWSNATGVALQLEQRELVTSFLSRAMRVYQHDVTIIGEGDRYVDGARQGGAFVVTVPFSRTMSHLRVAVRQSAIDAATRPNNEQWIVPIVIISVCGIVVLIALLAQVRLTKQQFELINRQRAFTTRVTHELKTPLAGIRVMAENLESGAFRTDEQRSEMARRIVEEADRLKSRVDEVLSVAQQRSIPSPKRYDPEEAVLGAIDLWGPRLEDADVKLHADLHPTDEMLGDADALRDAVGCLLDNALKYRDEHRSDPGVWLELLQEGRHVVITVADNGIGVPKHMRKAIFQRFVRVEGPNRGKAGGHGLGLNQVREVVEAHGGTVACVEAPQGGACFVLRLPAQRPS